MATCAECGREIERVFHVGVEVGGVLTSLYVGSECAEWYRRLGFLVDEVPS